jgi:hypothetical protein
MSRENVEVVRRCSRSSPTLTSSSICRETPSTRACTAAATACCVSSGRWTRRGIGSSPRRRSSSTRAIKSSRRYASRGRGRDGVEVWMRVFAVWVLRDGKVTRVTGGYRHRAEALEAARPEE